jgi:hypothetical protein
MSNETDYVDLGLACADVCRALDRGMDGKKLDDLSRSVCEAINQLTTWVKPAMRGLDSSPMTPLIAEPWRKSKGRSSNRAGGTRSLDFSMRRMIKRLSPVGSWSSTGSFMSLLCVQSFFARSPLIILFQTQLILKIHVNVSDIRNDMSRIREGIGGRVQPVSMSRIQSVEYRRVLTVSY